MDKYFPGHKKAAPAPADAEMADATEKNQNLRNLYTPWVEK